MRRVLGIAFSALLVTLVVLFLLIYAGFRAAQHEPAFYRQALMVEPQRQAEAGDELESAILELHNNSQHVGRWEAVFSAEQINGWLASDLPEKFPGMLPKGIQDPRVTIEPGQTRVACRFSDKRITMVVSLVLQADLTQETNTLAVRISTVRAGALPVPLRQFLDKISAAAQRGQIVLRWSQADGDPVALVTIPTEHKDYAYQRILLETVEMRDGEIYLAGRTEEPPEPPSLASQQDVTSPAKNSTVQR